MRLLDLAAFSPIFGPLSGRRVGYVRPQYGNPGDAFIDVATRQCLEAFGIPFVILNKVAWRDGATPPPAPLIEEVVLFGGGSMGAPFSGRLRIAARKLGRPTTLLPQSWRGPEEAPYERVFAREKGSLRYCPSALLAPDLALALEVPEELGGVVEDAGLFLRRDAEGLFRNRSSRGEPLAGMASGDWREYLRRAARFRKIVTDRLHFAIAGLLMRREVILLPNSYHKNRGVYDVSLAALGCGWAETPEEAMQEKAGRKPAPKTAGVRSRAGPGAVEVVILNWKRPRNVERILQALRKQTIPCKITLCDASPPGSEFELSAAVCAAADTWYRFGRNFGSLNRFIPAFGYMEEFLYYQDDDFLPGPRALEWLLACAEQRPDFAVLGEKGRILRRDGVYRGGEVTRSRTEYRPVDFVVRAGLVRTENLFCLDWFRRKMGLHPAQQPNLLREDDLLLCTAIQAARTLPCLITPTGDSSTETDLFSAELPAPHALSAQQDHYANRTRFLAAARAAGWHSLVGCEEPTIASPRPDFPGRDFRSA